MKKTYICPHIEPHTICATQIIAGSINKGEDLNDDNMGDVDILSREDNSPKSSNPWENEW